MKIVLFILKTYLIIIIFPFWLFYIIFKKLKLFWIVFFAIITIMAIMNLLSRHSCKRKSHNYRTCC